MIMIPSNYASARWVDFGNWFGGSDQCINSPLYDAEACGSCEPLIIYGVIAENRTCVPGSLQRPGTVKFHYYYQTEACCGEGLVWAPDPPQNMRIYPVILRGRGPLSKDATILTVIWNEDPIPESIVGLKVYVSINRQIRQSRDEKAPFLIDGAHGKRRCKIRNLGFKEGDKVRVELLLIGKYGISSAYNELRAYRQ